METVRALVSAYIYSDLKKDLIALKKNLIKTQKTQIKSVTTISLCIKKWMGGQMHAWDWRG